MAQAQKIIKTPVTPQTLLIFMEGFNAQSEKDAKLIFEQAIKSISTNYSFTKYELKTCYSLFRMINPKDDFEKLWCAQFIITHLLATHNLSLQSPRDKHIGLKLLKASHDALERIDRNRNGIS